MAAPCSSLRPWFRELERSRFISGAGLLLAVLLGALLTTAVFPTFDQLHRAGGIACLASVATRGVLLALVLVGALEYRFSAGTMGGAAMRPRLRAVQPAPADVLGAVHRLLGVPGAPRPPVREARYVDFEGRALGIIARVSLPPSRPGERPQPSAAVPRRLQRSK